MRHVGIVVCGLILLLGEVGALADPQCAVVTAAQANKVSSILSRGSSFLWYCQPCGDRTPGDWRVLDELAVIGSGNGGRQIKINGLATDLAYVYYRTAMGTAHNLGHEVGCPVQGVSEVLTFRPTVAKARYTLTIRIQIASTNNGSDWDPDGSPPDPVLTLALFQGEQTVANLSCPRQADTYVATCVVTVDADDQSAIAGTVRDHDAFNDDDVGVIATSLEQAVKNPGRAVPMRSIVGQIRAATVTLAP